MPADLGRTLDPDNAGALQWGDAYRAFHVDAWTEAVRVLRPGGRLVLNVKNHIRRKVEQPVHQWHVETLRDLGLTQVGDRFVGTPSMRA